LQKSKGHKFLLFFENIHKEMKNRVVIITGASSGIGKACAKTFGKAGASIVLAARNADKLESVSKDLSSMEIDNISVQTDVSIEQDCRNLIEKTIEKYGRIDIMLNNAGISMRALFQDVDLSVIKQVMDINFWGTVYCTKFALPKIIESKGSVVGISSIAGYKGLPGRTGYSASKFAMHGFLESLRIEMLNKSVHVLLACPGFTASNIRNAALDAKGDSQGESPMNEGKIMSSEEVAEAIYKAVDNRKRDLILTSQGKMTVLANKFLPGFVDKKVFNHFANEKDSPLK
jgi:short-subunit dehydrogenase